MLYLSAEFFFLDHIVFVTNVFSFVAILFGVKIKFDITSEFVCVSSKWLVMFHVISHKIQIKSYLLHIYMNVWCYSTAILDALSERWIFLPGLYCVCNEYFLLCRHFNCCQDYIWHIIWIILCFIQFTSYVSCCFTLNANWKIHSSFKLKETSNWKKIQRFFQAFSLAKQ